MNAMTEVRGTLPAEVPDALDDLRRVLSALAPATRRAYMGAARTFLAAGGEIELLSDRVIADHLSALHGAGAAPATVKVAAAGLRAIGRGLGLDVSGPLTTAEIRRSGREGRSRGRGAAAPADWAVADAAATLAADEGGLAGLRDAAIVRVASDAMLRVSEIAALEVGDITYGGGGVTVRVRASKTDQTGRGASLFLGPPTADAVDRYLAAAGHEDDTHGPLFRRVRRGGHPDPGGLTGRSVRTILSARLRAAGAKGRISGHSTRRGGAVSLVRAGADLAAIMQAGRWADAQQVERYARGELAAKGAVSRLRYGGVAA